MAEAGIKDSEKSRYTHAFVRGHPLLGKLREIRNDSLGFFADCGRRGDIVTFRLAYRRVHAIHHPDLVKEVLVTKHERYVKKGIYSRIRPVFRNGLVTSLGELWRKQRRSIQPMFTKKNLETLIDKIDQEVSAFGRTLEQRVGEQVDIYEEMLALTMRIMTTTMFSDDVSERREEISDHIYFLNGFMIESAYKILPPWTWIPTARNRRYQAAMRTLDGITQELVEKRKASGELGDDFLGMLLKSEDPETGERMSEKQVRDEAVAFFIAGHETTAAGLSWTYHLLDRHPEVLEKVHGAVDAAAIGDSEPMDSDVVKSLDYLEHVFLESMRVFPPIHITYREASEDMELGGVRVKKGDTIAISPYALNRQAHFWTEPERFDPERFAGPESANRYVFMPFGAGPRSCIGSHFALMEARMILARLGARLTFRSVQPNEPTPEPLITLKPKEPLWLEVRSRTAASEPVGK